MGSFADGNYFGPRGFRVWPKDRGGGGLIYRAKRWGIRVSGAGGGGACWRDGHEEMKLTVSSHQNGRKGGPQEANIYPSNCILSTLLILSSLEP